MHCPYHNDIRDRMMVDLENLGARYNKNQLDAGDLFLNLLGKHILDIDIDIMKEFWVISGKAISGMYIRSERARLKTEIG